MKMREILRILRPLQSGHDFFLTPDRLIRCRLCDWPISAHWSIVRCTPGFITVRDRNSRCNWRYPVPDCKEHQVTRVQES